MTRTYKGFEIVKQIVSPNGWNVAQNGRCLKTGFNTLADAKEWINFRLDAADAAANGF